MPAHPALDPTDTFAERHLGPSDDEVAGMLEALGLPSLEALVRETVPESIRRHEPLALERGHSESTVQAELRALADQNEVFRSFLGMGYHDCLVPAVIQRNVLENPGWYTQYTPYQAEIAQGRLEALLNFQTMVADLTGLPIAGASLLDEATAAAEAMSMCRGISKGKHDRFLVAQDCHPQTIAVVQGRGQAIGIDVVVCDPEAVDLAKIPAFGALLQYPTTDGRVADPRARIERLHAAGTLVVVATDLLALTLLEPPGALGADVAVGTSQRFGVPMGFGGPHAAFLSTKDEFRRHMPGRIIGVSRDARGKPAYRLSLQTREQHIRREKATSNICTAQVLLAVMASMYAVYHGPRGLRRIATRVHTLACVLAEGLRRLGVSVPDGGFFDTLRVRPADAAAVVTATKARRMNVRDFGDGTLGIALDEATTREDLDRLLEAFAAAKSAPSADELAATVTSHIPEGLRRKSDFLTHPTFNRFHAEHELLRYLHRLEAKDLSLTTSMIPLGSCTMKLNATTEMYPVSWPEIGEMHPFAPADQTLGYRALFKSLESMLAEITGLPGVSLQPNAGSQGEYAGLLVIRAYHESRGDKGRNVCLIPVSAHGTNPASAVMAGFKVVVVACDEDGNIDLADLRAKARDHATTLGALMLTYPSTHGVFEETVRDVCAVVHAQGGQVYMDGANMNAQVGLCRPGDIGADVCHLNLHKTFCIPHGGGGPGMGPICTAVHLQPFLPGHPVVATGGAKAIAPVSAAPWGSPSILPISWAYIRMMGSEGLQRATEIAILNANYMAGRLEKHYEVLYRGSKGRVAHEFILDLRPLKASAGIEAEDVAKRLMDYGFHAPTMSFPVPGTLMIEPTESESKEELDRFCEAMIAIREEIRAIEQGKMDREDNPLKNAPHPAAVVCGTEWPYSYSREQAAFPAPWVREHKYWPAVARIDNAYGDRNLVCTCLPIESYTG